MSKTIYIPLGTRCNGATIIKEHIKGRQFSMPFDWIDIPIKNISKIIGFSLEEFRDYLLQVKSNTQRHPDGTWLPHDIDYVDHKLSEVIISKYQRRFERFKQVLSEENDLCFLTVLAHASGQMGDAHDFYVLKDIILSKTKNKCKFITINLSKEDFESTSNHFNFHVPLPYMAEPDGTVFADWEKVIYDRIKLTVES